MTEKPGLGSRSAATKLLSAIVDKKTSMDGLLDAKGGNPVYLSLPENDRALVKAILLTTLRNYRVIDGFIDQLLERPLPSGAVSLRHLMRIAATQILFLDVPDHSAVDLAVEQANSDPRNRRFAKLVNAILRRMSREKEKRLSKLQANIQNFPDWYIEKLASAYGKSRADQMIKAMSAQAPIDITVKDNAKEWAQKLGGAAITSQNVRLLSLSGPVQQLDGFDEGQWWVQDISASIPARLFGDLTGKHIVDLCAAPGGKTAQLVLSGGDVTALDRSKSRLNRLNENLARLQLSAKTELARMEDYKTDDLFDAALLDAPCSSTGTIRRHPDVIWTKDLSDIEKLAKVQRGLLEHAITLVKPGGLIVFSNCSLDMEEGEDMVKQFVSEHGDKIEIIPIDKKLIAGFEQTVTSEGFMRITPDFELGELSESADSGINLDYRKGVDGFFAALLRVL